MPNRFTNFFSGIWKFARSRGCILHILLMIVFIALCFILLNWWLKVYTNHSQQLVLPKYEGMPLEEVVGDAKSKTFEIVITDSIHLVGIPGGQIIKQNPQPQSKVKEKRKIYVTVTKFNPDKISVAKLPVLYGENYERKKRELLLGFELISAERGRVFDRGPVGHIMEVWYEGIKIISRDEKKDNVELDKGSTLYFVLSQQNLGMTNVPNLICMKFEEAVLTADVNKIGLRVELEDSRFDPNDCYVAIQTPQYDPHSIMQMGDSILIYLTPEIPGYCAN